MSPFRRLLASLRPRKPSEPKAFGLVAAASLAWGFCYPPFPLGPLAFVVLAPFFIGLAGLSAGQAFRYAFAGGILYNTAMYWWIYNVVKVGPALVIGMGLVVLILFLSLFNGVLGWLFRILAARPWGLALFPLLWAGLEVVRTWGQMSFPWSHMGYALGHHLALIQAASFLGVFGLSAAVIAVNTLLFASWRLNRERPTGLGRRGSLVFLALALAIPAALWTHGALSLRRPDPAAPTLDIAMVQPSIPQTKKWDEHYFQEVMSKTWRTMEDPGPAGLGKGGASPLAGADLIVLPETAVPDFLRSRGDIQARLAGTARMHGADLIVGALDFEPDDKPYRAYRFYNSAFHFPGLHPDSASAEADTAVKQYSKLRLVPFSERLPFDDILPLINYVNLGEGDFSAGDGYAIWNRKVPYAPSICYEVIYPDYVRGARRRGAVLLVNITNDGWFGFSNAPFQHANITRFRAVEAGMPIARSANSGISVFYDSKGRILGKTELFEQTVLRHKVPLNSRDTWYLRHGDWVEALLGGLFLLGLPIALWLNRPKIT